VYSLTFWGRFYDEPSHDGGSLGVIVLLIIIVAAIIYSKKDKK